MKIALIVIGVFVILLVIASYIVFFLLSDKNADLSFLTGEGAPDESEDNPIEASRIENGKWLLEQNMEIFSITNKKGLKLCAHYLPAKSESNTYAICIHGYRANGIKEYRSIAKFYHEQGINVLLPDQRACGLSEGRYLTYGELEYRDGLLWIDYLLEKFGKDINISLHGISMGSATVMMMCGTELPKNVKLAVADCGYDSTEKELKFEFKNFKLPIRLFYFLYRLSAMVIGHFDPSKTKPFEALKNAMVPMIFVHGEKDTIVPPYMSDNNFEKCQSKDKMLFKTPGANHTESFELNEEYKDELSRRIKAL